jgi:hypothetical protein
VVSQAAGSGHLDGIGPVRLRDVVDLEAQLGRDASAPGPELAARDRELLDGVAPSRGEAPAALVAWLEALRAKGEGFLPGRRVEGAVRLVRGALVAAGLVLGWGSMAAVLRFDGGHPVNVWHFLLVFVLAQLLLLVLLVGSVLLRGAGDPAELGPVLALVASLVRKATRRMPWSGEALAGWRSLGNRWRSRRRLYAHLEPWLLLELTQGFGVAFNAAALSAAAGLLLFTDIAFSWSTTISWLTPERFHHLTTLLALPWAASLPGAVPSLEVVQATQYSRLASAYVSSGGAPVLRPDLAGGWWPYLLAALVTYGLLPRVVMLVVSVARYRWGLVHLPFDDPDAKQALRRLAGILGTLRPAAGPTGVRSEADECDLVRWRDAPRGAATDAWIRGNLGVEVTRELAAGCFPWEGEPSAVLGSRPRRRPVVVLAETFEAPDRALTRFLRGVRAATSPSTDVRVLLAAIPGSGDDTPRPADVEAWREVLGGLADPYLRLEREGAP